jgi:hypothetical protein
MVFASDLRGAIGLTVTFCFLVRLRGFGLLLGSIALLVPIDMVWTYILDSVMPVPLELYRGKNSSQTFPS